VLARLQYGCSKRPGFLAGLSLFEPCFRYFGR
jgi:hypothetical protein